MKRSASAFEPYAEMRFVRGKVGESTFAAPPVRQAHGGCVGRCRLGLARWCEASCTMGLNDQYDGISVSLLAIIDVDACAILAVGIVLGGKLDDEFQKSVRLGLQTEAQQRASSMIAASTL